MPSGHQGESCRATAMGGEGGERIASGSWGKKKGREPLPEGREGKEEVYSLGRYLRGGPFSSWRVGERESSPQKRGLQEREEVFNASTGEQIF